VLGAVLGVAVVGLVVLLLVARTGEVPDVLSDLGDLAPEIGTRQDPGPPIVGNELSVSPNNPVDGEHITFSGRLVAPHTRRDVTLQRRDDETWTPVADATSGSDGRFTITTPAAAPGARYRVYAEAFDDDDVVHPPQRTPPLRVRTREPTAELELLFAPIGQSPDGRRQMTPGRALFTPPREGRVVEVQRRTSDGWQTITTERQGPRGGVAFQVEPADRRGRLHRYRAVAAEANGAAAVMTSTARARSAPLIFEDEFDAGELDRTVWDYRQVGLRHGSRLCAESAPGSVSVSDGRLRLLTRPVPPERERDPDGCPHGEFDNGHIGTAGRFSFRYGIAAARIRFPHQEGQHGAFWAQPEGSAGVPGDPAITGAEIDVAEYFGDGFRDGALQNSIYWMDRDEELRQEGRPRDLNHLLPEGERWSDGFHVYSVEWTPEQYIFRVNGHRTFRTDRGVSQIPQYLILSLLTSDWELPNLDTDELTPMQVDWVRVWQPAELADADDPR